ncbi:histone-lysine N-methyltransferase SETDB2-like [Hyperolius riggenbachi]|uniref:histone-lysine N-methyltransferase SETDB2-like n=1 Tax=Hyperolius riggenbachi TaxID=752182 RepID=UPI0035A3A47D
MKHSETLPVTPKLSPSVSSHIRKHVSICETKEFWQTQRVEGKVDFIFKQIQERLNLLCKKIKAGSATDREYRSAFLLANEDLQSKASNKSSKDVKLPKGKDQTLKTKEKPSASIYDFGKEVIRPIPDMHRNLCAIIESGRHEEHICGPKCLSGIDLYFSRDGNPLKYPILCHFKRLPANSDLSSRMLNIKYKAPCGKTLRDFKDVRSYLFQTKCNFLFLDHFSFSSYIQLDRNYRILLKSSSVVQEADISREVENIPVSFCNEIDNTRPSPFKYREAPWPRGYALDNFTDLFKGCCDCTDGCLDVSKCACLQLTAQGYNQKISPNQKGTPGYKYRRLQNPIPTGLYECNVSCRCNRTMCQNRVVQQGLQVRLQVYKTKEKGWGVRCLDDLDKGTFVCIYAGRVMMKAVDAGTQQHTIPCRMPTTDDKPSSACSKRKRHASHSDSEISIVPLTSANNRKPGDPPVTTNPKPQEGVTSRDKGLDIKRGNMDFSSIRRPKSKTAMLQKRRKEVLEKGVVTVQISSDEEDDQPAPSAPKASNASSSRHQGEKLGDVAKNMARDMMRTNDTGYSSDNSTLSTRSSDSYPHLAASKENLAIQHPDSAEELCIIDASQEGNVARFFNHSCSPNLFVQHVFVESHSKKFPWTAFFTKSLVKAGTELTWKYNYVIGSAPDMEIPCLCGSKTCRGKII